MRTFARQHETQEGLRQELAALLQPLIFRAADGLSCRGTSFTLHAYPTAPFGERSFLDLIVERAVAPAGTTDLMPPVPQCLALELMPHAGEPPAHPARLVRARNALARILEDPDLGDADKDDAAAALGRLNLPDISPGLMGSLKFLVGVICGESRSVKLASLDQSGFGFVAEVRLDAQCWLRVRNGPVLALEIAERLRSHSLVAGQPTQVRSEVDDWEMMFEPEGAADRTSDVRVVLRADAGLGFASDGFAVVARPAGGGTEWHLAVLAADGQGVLAGLPDGRYQLGIALAPQAVAAFGFQPTLGARPKLGDVAGEAPRRVQTDDPALGNSRCVWVHPTAAGRARVSGESPLRGTEQSGRWRGEAEAAFTPTPVRVHGVVRTRGGAAASKSGPLGPLACLVLL